MTGKDADGNTIVIIEGKFWANLTENQPNRYLDDLAVGGKLLFLAPGTRTESLKSGLEDRINGEDDRMLVRSWNDFLNLVEIENNKNHDAALASDLNQLKALCQKMDVEGMPPLSQSDLDLTHGRVLAQLADVIDECNGVLRNWEHSNFSRYKTWPKKYGHGFYFSAYHFVCYLCVSSEKWYIRDNHTPIWLFVDALEGELDDAEIESNQQKINHTLKIFDRENSFDNEFGIILTPGMDKSQVVEHIVSKVKQTLNHLNANTPG